jgi:hypothetical protein
MYGTILHFDEAQAHPTTEAAAAASTGTNIINVKNQERKTNP